MKPRVSCKHLNYFNEDELADLYSDDDSKDQSNDENSDSDEGNEFNVDDNFGDDNQDTFNQSQKKSP